jgi:hypothetical protein
MQRAIALGREVYLQVDNVVVKGIRERGDKGERG